MVKENKARVRVFFGEIEGDNETIRDGLRSIAAAVNKTFQSKPPIVKILAVDNSVSDEELIEQVEEQLADESDGETLDNSAPSAAKVTKPPSQKKSKPPSYNFVKDLNLRPDSQQSLRDFFAQKTPDGQQEQLTVIVYYLQHLLAISKITCDHVYTGLKEVSIPVPTWLPQALRNVAKRKNWIDYADIESIKTTVAGDNFVEHDLPHKAGKNGPAG